MAKTAMGKVRRAVNKKAKPVSLIVRQADCADVRTDARALTLLCAKGIPQTKVYGPGLKSVKAWSNAKHFRPFLALPRDIHELSAVLTEAASNRHLCVVRGYLINAMVAETTRDKDVIKDTARFWLMVDMDGFPPPTDFDWRKDLQRAAEWAVKAYLPESFANAAFHYSFSSSAGIKKGLRVHVWFWLALPADSKTLKKYFKPVQQTLFARYNPGRLRDEDIEKEGKKYKDLFPSHLDIGIYDSIQVHYNAVPEFEVLREDPLSARPRHGLVSEGRALTVALESESAAPVEWVPSLDDLTAMVPKIIEHYPKLMAEWDGVWPGPWKKAITAFKHHLVKVLRMDDGPAFDWVEREFSQKLPGGTGDNRRNWDNSAIDLAPGQGGQLTVGTLIQWAAAEGWTHSGQESSCKGNAVADAVSEWVYFDALKLFYRFATNDKWDEKQIDNSFPRVSVPVKDKPPQQVPMSEYLLHRASDFMKVHSPTYLPGCRERFVEVVRRSTLDSAPRKVTLMNLWTDGDVVAAPGDAAPFLDHVSYLIPDPVERHLFMASLGWIVRRRGKIMFAILLQGAPGTGKSWVVSLIQMLLGILNCREVENEELTNTFNDWVEGVELVVVNEIRAPGSDKKEMMNQVKSIITQPTVRINSKHQKRYEMPTPRAFICMTNDDEPIYIEDGDRRWFVVKSPAVPKSEGEYEALFEYSGDLEQIKQGRELTAGQRANLGAIKHLLENYPLEAEVSVNGIRQIVRFNGHGRAPETEGRKELVELNHSDSFKWVQDSIRNRKWPFTPDVINTQAIVGEPGNLPLNLRSMTARKLSIDLRKASAVPIGNMMLPVTDELVRCWAVRNIEQWRAASDKARGAHWKHFVDLANDIEKARDDCDKRVYEEIMETKRAHSKGREGKLW